MKLTADSPQIAAKSAIILAVGAIALLLLTPIAIADTTNDEINHLISSVGRDGCSFIRNGRTYRGRAAREHLRSKRQLNEHLVDSTEEFIKIIASKSSTTGKPYLIQCRGQEETTANEWFGSLLTQFRELGNHSGTETWQSHLRRI